MIAVWVNGERREVPPGTTVSALVALLGAAPEGVAVAVDGAVVPRREHPGHVLADGTRVEVIRAVGGG